MFVTLSQINNAVSAFCSGMNGTDDSGGKFDTIIDNGTRILFEIERLASPDECFQKLILSQQACVDFWQPIVDCTKQTNSFYGGHEYWSCYEFIISLSL